MPTTLLHDGLLHDGLAADLQKSAPGTVANGQVTVNGQATPFEPSHFLGPEWSLSSLSKYEPAKRFLDALGSLVGLAISVPIICLAAIFIKIHDGGPVFFKQTRVGRGGKQFGCWKLRTMIVNAEELKASLAASNAHGDDHRTFKIQNDPRVTPVGRVLRRWSIDELPQFTNVLMGDMSLVGPRPAVVSEVERYTELDRLRLLVKPGLTCIWQVSGRSALSFSDQIKLDLEYIKTASLRTDLLILARTLPAVFSCRGAH